MYICYIYTLSMKCPSVNLYEVYVRVSVYNVYAHNVCVIYVYEIHTVSSCIQSIYNIQVIRMHKTMRGMLHLHTHTHTHTHTHIHTQSTATCKINGNRSDGVPEETGTNNR